PPSRVAVFPGDGLAYVAWNPPVLEGASPVQSYTVTSSRGDHLTVSAEQFRRTGFVTVPKLVDGTAYTFTVTARNRQGVSSRSLPSNPVTVARPAVAPTPPTVAPVSVSARPGDGSASIHFKDPAQPAGPGGGDAGRHGAAARDGAARDGRPRRRPPAPEPGAPGRRRLDAAGQAGAHRGGGQPGSDRRPLVGDGQDPGAAQRRPARLPQPGALLVAGSQRRLSVRPAGRPAQPGRRRDPRPRGARHRLAGGHGPVPGLVLHARPP